MAHYGRDVPARRPIGALGRPVDAAVGARRGPAVVVLLYHRVGGRTGSPVDLPRAKFERQLDELAEAMRRHDPLASGERVAVDQEPDVPALAQAVKLARNIRVATIAPLLGEAIGRTATESSVSSLFV